jgi:hypothetical protein
LDSLLNELNNTLFSGDEQKQQVSVKFETGTELQTAISSQVGATGIKAGGNLASTEKDLAAHEAKSEYVSKKSCNATLCATNQYLDAWLT